MRTLSIAMLAVALVVAAMVPASAQCPPMMEPPLDPSSPAVIGAGPAPDLATLTGTAFDEAYLRSMYQLRTNIMPIATLGIEQAQDRNLRDLSGKIRTEMTDQNQKVAMWYRDMGFGTIPVDYSRANTIANTLLTYTGPEFDIQYARVMAGLLNQANTAAQLAVARTTNDEIRNQAEIVVRATQNEIVALQRWVGDQTVRTTPDTGMVTPAAPTTPGTTVTPTQ